MKKRRPMIRKILTYVAIITVAVVALRQEGIKKVVAKIPFLGRLLTGLNPDGTTAA